MQYILLCVGESAKHEFQSETQMLLQIVAKSLYSDKEVRKYEFFKNYLQ